MAEHNRTHEVTRECGGIVHSDGSITFANRYQFEHAASILLGTATVQFNGVDQWSEDAPIVQRLTK